MLIVAQLLLAGCACALKGTGSSCTPTLLASTCHCCSGVGINEQTFPPNTTVQQLAALNVSWYYNWGTSTSVVNAPAPFVPMAWAIDDIPKLPAFSQYVLGFNEPDDPHQSNITVPQALAAWSNLTEKAEIVGAPAMAGNPVESGSWLSEFLAGSPTPRVDFIPVHFYGGDDPSVFITYVQNICDFFKVFEFGCEDILSFEISDPERPMFCLAPRVGHRVRLPRRQRGRAGSRKVLTDSSELVHGGNDRVDEC
eukprot:m.253486 g.253486  ORF g.253486 m.253486 type:complete len:253 (+) comp54532_c0_seq38:2374-3132(+)